MGFEPSKINKDHILKAIEKIELEQIDLLACTRWLVEINGQSYPPKEVMRYAHEQLNGGKNMALQWRKTNKQVFRKIWI